MNRFVRYFPVLVVIALLAFSPIMAFAQDGGNPLCNGLAEADCQIITGASAAMDGVTSFSMPAWSINLNFAAGTDTGSFSATGSGSVMLPTDPANPTEGLQLHLVIDEASSTSASGTQSGSAEVILKGDTLYIKYNDEWYGEQMSEEDKSELTDVIGQVTGTADAEGGLGIDLSAAMTTTRGEDVDGNAAFATDIDVAQLLTAVLASPLVGEALGATGEAGTESMTPEDLQMIGAFLGPMLTGTTITASQHVGLEDNYLRMIALDVALNLDASMLSPEIGVITGAFNFMSEMDEFNGTFEVTVPETYKPMDDLDIETPDLGL